jgi:hypothetical protein
MVLTKKVSKKGNKLGKTLSSINRFGVYFLGVASKAHMLETSWFWSWTFPKT